MIVNITKLNLTLQKRDDGATILAMTLKNNVMKHQISPYLWNLEHISLFAAYLAGETSPTYRMAFTDLSQTITDVGPRGEALFLASTLRESPQIGITTHEPEHSLY